MRLTDNTIPIALGKKIRILFVGDNKQLPPVGDDFEWTNVGSSAYDFIHEMFHTGMTEAYKIHFDSTQC